MANKNDLKWDARNPSILRWLLTGAVVVVLGVGVAVASAAPIRGPARAAQAFMAASLEKPGMKETDSGLQYQILAPGEGPHPTKDDVVIVNYEGRLVDGTVFDSSYSRGQPAVLGVSEVIPGWTEGLQLMRPGGKAHFVIPPQLAYGARGAGGVIPPNAVIEFDVELLGIAPRQ